MRKFWNPEKKEREKTEQRHKMEKEIKMTVVVNRERPRHQRCCELWR
jgi:hypothetical protein